MNRSPALANTVPFNSKHPNPSSLSGIDFLGMAHLLPGHFFIYDLNDTIIYENRIRQEDPLNEQQQQQRLAHNQKVIQQRRTLHVDEAGQWQNQAIHFSTYKAPLYDTSGYIIGLYGYSVNISEHRQTQNSLIELKASMSALLDFIETSHQSVQPHLFQTQSFLQQLQQSQSLEQNHTLGLQALNTLDQAITNMQKIAQSEQTLHQKTPHPVKPNVQQSLTVASVEDDPVSTFCLRHLFTTLFPSITLLSFHHPNPALKCFKDTEQHIDLFLLDISLPDLQGDQLALELRDMAHIPRSTPIIALTGCDTNQHKHRFDAIYSKPLNAEKLTHILQTHLSYKQYQTLTSN